MAVVPFVRRSSITCRMRRVANPGLGTTVLYRCGSARTAGQSARRPEVPRSAVDRDLVEPVHRVVGDLDVLFRSVVLSALFDMEFPSHDRGTTPRRTFVSDGLTDLPRFSGFVRRAMFPSGDDADARAVVSALIDDIGYAPLDLGRLASGSALQQLGGPLAGLDLRLALPRSHKAAHYARTALGDRDAVVLETKRSRCSQRDSPGGRGHLRGCRGRRGRRRSATWPRPPRPRGGTVRWTTRRRAARLAADLRSPSLGRGGRDIHWADDATLGAIRCWQSDSPGLPVSFSSPSRETDAAHLLRRLLVTLTGPCIRRVTLQPLSAEAVHRLGAVSAAQAVEIHRVTRGNPFLVTEVLAAGGSGVAHTVRDAVVARLGTPSPAARTLVDRLSVVPTRAERGLAETPAEGDAGSSSRPSGSACSSAVTRRSRSDTNWPVRRSSPP